MLVFFLFCWMFMVCNFFFKLVMTSLQSILENVDTPELLCKCVKCILLVARCYPHIFSTNFRVSTPIPSFLMTEWEIDFMYKDLGTQVENKASAPLSIIMWCSRIQGWMVQHQCFYKKYYLFSDTHALRYLKKNT